MELAGVDGCRGGWVVAEGSGGLKRVRFVVVEGFEAVVGRAERVAVDMPVGLPEAGARGCDVEARRWLGRPRGSSVFPAPCRAALGAESYLEACARSVAAGSARPSRQLFNILPRVREVDAVVTPELQARVRETHPEVTFAVLSARGRGLEYGKKTPEGRQERWELLRRVGVAYFDPEEERERLGKGRVAVDDVLDAAACLVTAWRMARGEEWVLPEGRVEYDQRGLRMEIVA